MPSIKKNWVINGLRNGLLPVLHQAITQISPIAPQESSKLRAIWSKGQWYSFKKMQLKMPSAKCVFSLSNSAIDGKV